MGRGYNCIFHSSSQTAENNTRYAFLGFRNTTNKNPKQLNEIELDKELLLTTLQIR